MALPEYHNVPRSVYWLDRLPRPVNSFRFGTRFYQLLTAFKQMYSNNTGTVALLNELRTKIHTAGDIKVLTDDMRARAVELVALATELRTRLHTAGDYQALISELRTRLHTAGDYQALLSGLRALFVNGGEWHERMLDLEDKAYNQLLNDPFWQQNTGMGGNAMFESVSGCNAICNGVFYNMLFGMTQNIPMDPGTVTGPGEFRAVTLSLDAAGVLTHTVSPIAAAAPVTPPRPPSGEVPVGVIQIPASYAPGVTPVETAWFTQGFPRRLPLHTTFAVADVAAIASADVAAIVAGAPAVVTAPAVAAVTNAASTAMVLAEPDALPDTDI
jgi:hypothetical protein